MLTQFQQRDELPDERANLEAIELSTETRPSAPDKGATLMQCDIETTNVEDNRAIAHMLDLSASRAYAYALEILGVYKLTGNFPINLEIVLRDIGAFDKVTFEVEPRSQLPYFPD